MSAATAEAVVREDADFLRDIPVANPDGPEQQRSAALLDEIETINADALNARRALDALQARKPLSNANRKILLSELSPTTTGLSTMRTTSVLAQKLIEVVLGADNDDATLQEWLQRAREMIAAV